MPRSGGGIYSLPAGSTVSNGDTAVADDLNVPLADIEADLNTVRPVVAGGTGAASAADARTNLGLVIGTNVQAYDAALQSIAGLTTAADRMIYTTAADTYAVAPLTSFARTILDDADAATVRATIGAQASDAALTSLAGLSLSNGDILYATGADTLARLAAGTNGQTLQVSSGVPAWVTVSTPSGLTLLGTATTTSGTSQQITGLTLTGYKFLRIAVRGVSADSASAQFQINGVTFGAAATATNVCSGVFQVDLGSGAFGGSVAEHASGSASAVLPAGARAGNCGVTTATTTLTFATTAGSFDAGSIVVWGEP